jgi:hypothetical protein
MIQSMHTKQQANLKKKYNFKHTKQYYFVVILQWTVKVKFIKHSNILHWSFIGKNCQFDDFLFINS